MSISVAMTSVVSQNTNTNSGEGGSLSTIEALQKKLVSLQKELKDAVSSNTKEGLAKAKLIQLQITATQAQLDQLIQQKAKESSDKQAQNKADQENSLTQNKKERSTNKTSLIDAYA